MNLLNIPKQQKQKNFVGAINGPHLLYSYPWVVGARGWGRAVCSPVRSSLQATPPLKPSQPPTHRILARSPGTLHESLLHSTYHCLPCFIVIYVCVCYVRYNLLLCVFCFIYCMLYLLNYTTNSFFIILHLVPDHASNNKYLLNELITQLPFSVWVMTKRETGTKRTLSHSLA